MIWRCSATRDWTSWTDWHARRRDAPLWANRWSGRWRSRQSWSGSAPGTRCSPVVGELGSCLAWTDATDRAPLQHQTQGPAVLVLVLDALSAEDRGRFQGRILRHEPMSSSGALAASRENAQGDWQQGLGRHASGVAYSNRRDAAHAGAVRIQDLTFRHNGVRSPYVGRWLGQPTGGRRTNAD